MDINLATRAPTSNNLAHDLKSTNVTPGIQEATSRPLRQVKLEGRATSLPASIRPLKLVKLEDGSGVPAQPVGFCPKQVILEEGTTFSAPVAARKVPTASVSTSLNIRPGVQAIEQQALQLPPGMDPSILEQVLKLTPEQLSLLPKCSVPLQSPNADQSKFNNPMQF